MASCPEFRDGGREIVLRQAFSRLGGDLSGCSGEAVGFDLGAGCPALGLDGAGGQFSDAAVTYSYLDGRLHRTTFTPKASGVGFGLGGANLILGTHPIADTLRALGLPRTALMNVWMEHQSATFEAPERA